MSDYAKETVVGLGIDGFSITSGELYPNVRAKLNAYTDLYEALKTTMRYLSNLDDIGKPHLTSVKETARQALSKAE